MSYSIVEFSGGGGENWNDAIGRDGGDNIDGDPDIRVTLQREQVEGANTYRVQVSSGDSLFNNVLIDAAVGEVEFQLLDLDHATRYPWRVRSLNQFTQSEWSEVRSFMTESITSVKTPSGIPSEFSLHQNYPNPFNPSTTMRYDLTVQFDAGSISSGVYLYRIQSGDYTQVNKLTLMR